MRNQITVTELIKWCKEYDQYYGMYPESDFEGEAIKKWIMAKLSAECEDMVK